MLSANHYPRKFIDRAYRAHPRPKPSDDSSFKKTVLIPYIGGLSEAIQRFLAEVDIRVVFRPLLTLRQQLVHPKDDTPTTKKSNDVYSIPCTTRPAVYIGQTSRTLNTRINEHKAAVKHARTEVQLSRNTSGRRSIKWTSRKLVFLPMNQTFTNAASWNLGTFRSSTPSIGK